MSNLLDKASIILTPTAYNNGEALCVKPSDGSGDFDFSRNSAATRVNAQGLVENVQILSSNLVQNGDFSEEGVQEVSNGSFSQEGVELVTNGSFDTDSDWNTSGNWTIGNGVATYDGLSNTKRIYQTVNFVQNKMYKISFDVTETDDGTIRLFFGQNATTLVNTNNYAVGSYVFYVTATTTSQVFSIYAYNSNSGGGSIDNCSVREVGQDWTLGTGWSIGEDKASKVSGVSSYLLQPMVLPTPNTYKVTFTVSDYVSGDVKYGFTSTTASVFGTPRTANGTYTEYFTHDSNTIALRFRASSTFEGSITNISVKEVGQNWELNTGWSIGSNVITTDGTINSRFYQDAVTTIGQTYKYSFDVLDSGGGVIDCRFRNGGGSIQNFSSEGTYTGTFVSYNTLADFTTLSGNTASFSITNISVIEITTDTSLPRINYENFSYQDALGSEEIVNGDFATDSDWLFGGSASISNGSANFTGSGDLIRQNIITQVGTYKVTFTVTGTGYLVIKNYTGGVLYREYTNISQGEHTIYIEKNEDGIMFQSFGFASSIDNVSVKEYLGQEVVPDSGCGSWLFEPQSTNLTSYSSDYTNWVGRISLSVDLNQGTSPSGETDANLISVGIDASATRHRLYNLNSFVLGNDYTFSVFAKKSDNNWFQLMFGQTAFGTQCYANFDLNNGVIGNVGTSTDANIVDYGNGWYRCLITCTATATSNTTFEILTTNNTNSGRYPSYQSTANTNVCFLWGAQLEEQSYATSYIPTENNPNGVTRNQDVCTNGGSLASINSTSGTLYAEIAALSDDGTTRRLAISDGSNNNRVFIGYSALNTVQFVVQSLGSLVVNSTFTISDITQFSKIAFKYKENDCSFWIDGIKVGTDTTASMPTGLSTLLFAQGDIARPFFGKTKALAVWKEALSDAELTELTTI